MVNDILKGIGREKSIFYLVLGIYYYWPIEQQLITGLPLLCSGCNVTLCMWSACYPVHVKHLASWKGKLPLEIKLVINPVSIEITQSSSVCLSVPVSTTSPPASWTSAQGHPCSRWTAWFPTMRRTTMRTSVWMVKIAPAFSAALMTAVQVPGGKTECMFGSPKLIPTREYFSPQPLAFSTWCTG